MEPTERNSLRIVIPPAISLIWFAVAQVETV